MRRLFTTLVCGVALLLLTPGLATAQDTGTIEGTVTDASTGESLPGATVQVLEEGIGSATDANGEYTIRDVPAGVQQLRVQFVGYQTVTRSINVPAGETITRNVELEQETAQLEEVVVSGYRVRQTRTEAGASEIVDADAIETATVQNPQSALQGQAAGVRVTASSGQPGAAPQFRIRGNATISSGSEPLYIVDGVQVNPNSTFDEASASPLNSINRSDIQSVEVLKDAAAASIYGAQAANGVVIITTKGGRAGDTEINFNTQLGFVERLNRFDVMDTEEWTNFVGSGVANFANSTFGTNLTAGEGRQVATSPTGAADLGLPAFLSAPVSQGGFFVGEDDIQTDWPGAVYRQGLTQTYNLSARGGNETTTFYVSGRFSRDEGQIISSFLRSGGLKANLSHQATDFLNVETRLNLATTTIEGTVEGGPFINSPFWAGYLLPPNSTVYNEVGNPESGFNPQPNFVFTENVVQQEEFNTTRSNQTNIIGNIALNWDIASTWNARTFAGLSFEDTAEEDYQDPRVPSNAGVGGELQLAADRSIDYNISQTFQYDNVFDSVHRVSGLAGTEFKERTIETLDANTQGFPSFLFRTADAAANPQDVLGDETSFRVLSFFGDAEYTYDNTYQLRSTLRYDGSSRFGEDNRWGLFGTVSAFWRLSEESFLQDVDFVDDLKLRASYGITGNSQIENFQSRRLFGTAGNYDGGSALAPASLGNNTLTWEERQEVNVGLDYTLFSGRISGSFNAYDANSSELLLERELPSDTGFNSYIDNVGQISTRGLEASIETVNLIAGDFQWRTNFNISFQRSEVDELLPDDNEIIVDPDDNPGVDGGGIFRVGEPISQYRYVRYAGVNPATGAAMYLDRNGNLTYNGQRQEDEVLLGNTEPDFFGGFGNTFTFKGVSLDVFFQYDYGRETLNNDAFFLRSNTFFYLNRDEEVLDYWKEPGDITDTPRPTPAASYSGQAAGIFTTRYYEDASYIRLKRAKLGYSLPQSLLERVSLSAASVFVQGENLVTFTEYTGFDPEVVGTGLGQYPQSRRYTVGLSITY